MRDSITLFNRDGNGSAEIVAAVGLISNGIDFDKWEPVLPLGIRDVVAIVGPDPVERLAACYNDRQEAFEPELREPLRYLQQAVALFAWLKIIPTLDAQHDEGGRSRRLGENEKGLTALQEFKDEENITRLAYEAVDALVEALDRGAFPFWTESRKYRQREGLLIKSKEEFDEYYVIGSHRLFVTLLPIMREVQGAEVAPVLGQKHLAAILQGDEEISALLKDTAARAVALLSIKKAVERLPVEVIPEGIVQIQQSQPVKSRLKAEQSARAAVAQSLGADADRCLARLQKLVAELDATDSSAESYIAGPIVHSKGMTF